MIVMLSCQFFLYFKVQNAFSVIEKFLLEILMVYLHGYSKFAVIDFDTDVSRSHVELLPALRKKTSVNWPISRTACITCSGVVCQYFLKR